MRRINPISRRWSILLTALVGFGIQSPASATAADYVLAVTWLPAFCEIRPGIPECTSQTIDRMDSDHFSLHGLWPQPRGNVYCSVAEEVRALDKTGGWLDLPELDLNDETRSELNRVMPGTRSGLHRHEWVKHGTCYEPRTADAYYRDSLRLLRELNNSAVRRVFAQATGKMLARSEIRDAFNRAFGDGAGDRISIRCINDGDRRLIVELKIELSGNPGLAPLGDLIQAAPPRHPGCRGGIVDMVGVT